MVDAGDPGNLAGDCHEDEFPASGHAPADAAPHLSIGGYDGPLDFLLEMVRRRQLDLAQLSIVELADQFVAALAASAGLVRLERRADWLVMASELLRLKSQLLAPASPREAAAAAAEAAQRLGQLEALATMRAAAAWLTARPQLGHAHFARGPRQADGRRPRAELLVAFLEATLVMLEGRPAERHAAVPSYRPVIEDLWRVPNAIARLIELLRERQDLLPLTRCVPGLPAAAPDRAIRTRAAVASTLVAALELARDGVLDVQQPAPFGTVLLQWHPAPASTP